MMENESESEIGPINWKYSKELGKYKKVRFKRINNDHIDHNSDKLEYLEVSWIAE